MPAPKHIQNLFKKYASTQSHASASALTRAGHPLDDMNTTVSNTSDNLIDASGNLFAIDDEGANLAEVSLLEQACNMTKSAAACFMPAKLFFVANNVYQCLPTLDQSAALATINCMNATLPLSQTPPADPHFPKPLPWFDIVLIVGLGSLAICAVCATAKACKSRSHSTETLDEELLRTHETEDLEFAELHNSSQVAYR
jgi:hypothetical protein